MSHSQGFSNNSYPEPKQSLEPTPISNDLPEGTIPTNLSVKILNALLPNRILTTCSVHLNILGLITLVILILLNIMLHAPIERFKLELIYFCYLFFHRRPIQ
jgi:hypothetical protein